MTDFEANRDTAKTTNGSNPKALPAKSNANKAMVIMTQGNGSNGDEKMGRQSRSIFRGREGAGDGF